MDVKKTPTNKSAAEDTVKLTKEIEDLKKSVDDWKNKYLRALADYQNLEKRVSEDKEEIMKMANIWLIVKLLPFLDNLEKAEVFVKDQGLKIVKDHLMQTLQEVGVKEVPVLAKEYDPHIAEAIDIVPGDKDNIVVEVLRKGYEFNNKIVRVAQVKVSKKIKN